MQILNDVQMISKLIQYCSGLTNTLPVLSPPGHASGRSWRTVAVDSVYSIVARYRNMAVVRYLWSCLCGLSMAESPEGLSQPQAVTNEQRADPSPSPSPTPTPTLIFIKISRSMTNVSCRYDSLRTPVIKNRKVINISCGCKLLRDRVELQGFKSHLPL